MVEEAFAAPKRALRPSQCRAHLRRELAREFPEMVAGFVKEAKSGSCQHLKLAAELLEVKPTKTTPPKRKGPGTLTVLLREMERRDAEKKVQQGG